MATPNHESLRTAMLQRLDHAERARRALSPKVAPARKAALGQFLTPAPIARFMAGLFPPSDLPICRLLDAGAGLGALTCAFLDRWQAGGFGFSHVEAFAHEVDDAFRAHLAQNLAAYPGVTPHTIGGDFIERASRALNGDMLEGNAGIGIGFTHAILNPPYRKIGNGSAHRLALRRAGIETVNLYAGFVALAVAMAAPGGQLVAIIPRSFCNGPYYKPFRDFILARAALRHIHLFAARDAAFGDDEVLQENVIIRLECGGAPGPVTVSTSTDDRFADLAGAAHPLSHIILPGDPERFIHIPTGQDEDVLSQSAMATYSPAVLGLTISTGPVVDFRLREHLRAMPGPGTVPLLHPAHVGADGCNWPLQDGRKPNAILRNDETERWLYPSGFYCVVRRFSAKEERRRIVAGVVDTAAFGAPAVLGFENHLNIFHQRRHGLPENLARGLAAFLNSTAADAHFRRFNGHTQVNATDLRQMRYPSREALDELGRWAKTAGRHDQAALDRKVGRVLG